MRFLKFCSVLLNMVYEYPTRKDCVVCSGSLVFGCVLSTWVLSSIVLLSGSVWVCLCRREGLFLYAITGDSGKIWLNVLLFMD